MKKKGCGVIDKKVVQVSLEYERSRERVRYKRTKSYMKRKKMMK
jgi:hypothetical protein